MPLAAVCALLSSRAAGGAFSQQGPKLVGTGAVNFAGSGVYQGWSTSLSADGNTAIVGGYDDDIANGAAWVFTRTNGAWTQQGLKLVDQDAQFAFQGWSVALSADGNTAIVGGYSDNITAGAAFVWKRTGNVWARQGNKLVGTGATGLAFQGYSVALSADGNTAIVGGIFDNGQRGAAWIWKRTNATWSQQGNKLVGSGAIGNSEQGWAVAVSADGNTALVGGYADDTGKGATWVWTRNVNNGVWSQQGPRLLAANAIGIAGQGSGVSLSADGNTAVIGGYSDDSGVGAVWIWKRTSGVWSQQGPKLVGTGGIGESQQGASVGISDDGSTAIVGSPGDNVGAGATWVWKRNGSVWTQQGGKLVGAGAVGAASQGYSVSLSGDGKTALIGGFADNANLGAAWVFAGSSSGGGGGNCALPERECVIPVVPPDHEAVRERGP